MQLKHANFDFDFQELFDKFIVQMMRYMKENKPDFNMEHFKLLNDDKEIVDEYNLIMNPLFNMLFEEDSNEKEKVNLFFEINTVLDSDFVTICQQNKNEYLKNKKFLFYMNPLKVIEKLEASSTKEIYSFISGIDVVYSFSNLNDFFKQDLLNINLLLENIDLDKLSKGKITKRIALEKLKTKLKNAKELIEK